MNNSDSMINPSIVSLLEKTETRYSLVISTSKRARRIIDGATVLTNKKITKPLTIAINEINENKVLVENVKDEKVEEGI